MYGISLHAQSSETSYSFKKGEVLDLLLLSGKPNSDSLFANYRKTAFPVAMRMSYTPMPGYRIKEYTQGNFHPQSFIFGKWESIAKREQFLAEIETHVPDFHQQRKNMFSLFHLTYYEMPTDVNFEIDKNKVVVVTAYWKDDSQHFQQFRKKWSKAAKRAKGKTVLVLENGKSPFGYFYQPEWLTITEWDSRAQFEAFKAKNLKIGTDGIKHVNQFILQ